MSDTGRIALVTGANKGIGRAIARQLAEAGVHVVLGARDELRADEVLQDLRRRGSSAETARIDLADDLTIAAAAHAIGSRHGRLDILINNAGIVDAADGPPSTGSVAAAQRIIETNFLGTLAVTQAMLPLLRRSPAGRIVNLSSSLGSLQVNGDPASPYYAARLIGYNASKAALNMLTVQLAAELRDTTIAVNSVSPGYVRTDLTGGQGFMSPEEAARLPVEYALMGENASTGTFVEPGGVATPW